jgi:hypothetical protein
VLWAGGFHAPSLNLRDQGEAVVAKDTSEILSDLHEGLALHLKAKLDDGTISSSELSVLERFLKANGVSAQPAEGSPFGDLVSSLPDLDKVVHMRRKAA